MSATLDISGAVLVVHELTEAEIPSMISTSHFLPSWRLKTIRSEANQADTAARPKELRAEKTVVTVEVTRL